MTSTGGGGRNKLFLKPDRLLDYMEILRLRRAISLLLEVRKGLSNIRMLHELRLLLHQLGISCSESCEVTINRLKMELESKVERTRRLEKNRKRFRQNGLFQRDAGRFTESWVSRLSRSLPAIRVWDRAVLGWYPRN